MAADHFAPLGQIGVHCGTNPHLAGLGQKGSFLPEIKAARKPLKYLAPQGTKGWGKIVCRRRRPRRRS